MPGNKWRSLALALAAVIGWAGHAASQEVSLDERLEQCASCHGADGNSQIENIPSLAGQPESFILDQLIYIREGVRQVEAMMPFVEDLSDAEAVALSEHFAQLPPKASDEAVNPALVERGAALAQRLRCHSCHGADLAGHDRIPRVAKQRIDYLFHALKQYRDGERRSADTLMSAAVAGLSDPDLRALAHYSASRQ